jgi:hypothetical protein
MDHPGSGPTPGRGPLLPYSPPLLVVGTAALILENIRARPGRPAHRAADQRACRRGVAQRELVGLAFQDAQVLLLQPDADLRHVLRLYQL